MNKFIPKVLTTAAVVSMSAVPVVSPLMVHAQTEKKEEKKEEVKKRFDEAYKKLENLKLPPQEYHEILGKVTKLETENENFEKLQGIDVKLKEIEDLIKEKEEGKNRER
ncbi:hypothetical protein [Bacillus sp. 196mf]|uniref:hypothetical protein n=1 Tax=Bacillus sp. 196mf TaxID=1761754 RepID=UPI000D7C6EA6|nr:hypothetical protein [Bacillus sp. 196mf]PYE88560.1 hypothetical protein ATL10_10447 [Bacillus sp. 196mf]